jgi:hypothetical protein
MMLRNGFLAAFALLVAAACLALPFLPQSLQPFGATPSDDYQAMVVLPSPQDLPMPPGLQAGDKAYFTEMNRETRSLFMVGSANPTTGSSFQLRVHRGDEIHDVTVQFPTVGFLSGDLSNRITGLANYALLLLIATLGLVLIWRGRSRATLGVAIWCLTSVAQSLVVAVPLPLPYCTLLGWFGTVVQNLGTLIGLYLVADDLSADARSPERRRTLHYVFATALALYVVCVSIYNGHFYFEGTSPTAGINLVVGLHLVGFLISLGMLIGGYKRSIPINQARIRWVLFSLVGLLITYLLSLAAGALRIPIPVLNLAGAVLSAAAFSGFAYAVLRHRLLSLEFVVNRALVYGLITSLVVGVFAALLAFLERTALNTETNRFLALLAPLLLGMGLNAIKRRVDERINKMFFRRRHRAEAELTQLARTSGYVEEPEKLLDLTAEELYRNSGAQGLAIYLSQKGKAGPKLVRKQGALEFPAKLGADDLALLRLKAGDAEVDLRGTSSALGNDGYAYALTVRGEVLGFIVCGPRPAEAYTPEERRLYTHVAQQVGVALHALRLQEQQRLLKDLAEGAFKSLPTARAKAKALIGASAA